MSDKPDIVKKLKKEENLGLLHSNRQSDYEKLELTENFSENAPVDAVGFVEDNVERIIEEWGNELIRLIE